MSDPTDVQNSIERMKICMELRGHRPMTVYTFSGYARRFLAHVGKAPAAVTAADVESFMLDLHCAELPSGFRIIQGWFGAVIACLPDQRLVRARNAL